MLSWMLVKNLGLWMLDIEPLIHSVLRKVVYIDPKIRDIYKLKNANMYIQVCDYIKMYVCYIIFVSKVIDTGMQIYVVTIPH